MTDQKEALYLVVSGLTSLIVYLLNIAGISRLSSVTILQPDQFVLSTNLFFKINVSLPLVTGELLQKTVDVTSVTYKLCNIKI